MTHKVLMVDDSLIACKIIELELSPFGYEVVAVDSIGRAVDLLVDQDVDAVMLDLSVAEILGGPTVLARLRAAHQRRHLPVILHSALAEEELAKRRGSLGADGAFRKGGRLVDLVKQLQQLSQR